MMTVILTGPTGSGKTTMLEKWASEREDVSGVLMPVRKGNRYIVSLRSGESRTAEAGKDTPVSDMLRTGKYTFRRSVFEWGCKAVMDSFPGDGITVIDEVGPLEIQGDGFCKALRYVLNHRLETVQPKILIVVREGLVPDAVRAFGIREYRVVSSLSELEKCFVQA